jgi:hypothetical protein
MPQLQSTSARGTLCRQHFLEHETSRCRVQHSLGRKDRLTGSHVRSGHRRIDSSLHLFSPERVVIHVGEASGIERRRDARQSYICRLLRTSTPSAACRSLSFATTVVLDGVHETVQPFSITMVSSTESSHLRLDGARRRSTELYRRSCNATRH